MTHDEVSRRRKCRSTRTAWRCSPMSTRRPGAIRSPTGTYDFVIVGAGPAGMLAARGAATLGRKVALIERNLLGGNCLNVGCVPSKALIRSAQLYARMRDAQEFRRAAARRRADRCSRSNATHSSSAGAPQPR